LRMPLEERKSRYEDMMRVIRQADLASWRDNFLRDLRAFSSKALVQSIDTQDAAAVEEVESKQKVAL
ncbi:hypothetical protein, partial [Vibrio parahaemolyticus]